MQQQNGIASSPVNLEWQSFPVGSAQSVPGAVQTQTAGAVATAAPAQAPQVGTFNVISLMSPAFYQSVFNIDTADVTARLKAAYLPSRVPSTFLDLVAANPDWYGPVWIAATLVFCIAAGSELASWLHFNPSEPTSIWKYNIESLTSSVACVYAFAFGAPVVVRAAMAYLGIGASKLGLVQLVCVWGYSLVYYLPAALLCVIPSAALQWMTVLAAVVLSTLFLAMNVYLPVHAEMAANAPTTRLLLPVLAGLQIVFATIMKLYFFTFSPAQ